VRQGGGARRCWGCVVFLYVCGIYFWRAATQCESLWLAGCCAFNKLVCLLPAHLANLVQEDYDGAEPAASSIALANLWRFAGLSGGEVRASGASGAACQRTRLPLPAIPQYQTLSSPAYLATNYLIKLQLTSLLPCLQEAARWGERAARCAAAFGERLSEIPDALPQMACSLHLLTLGHPRQVIVAGTRGAPDTEALVDAAFHSFTPGGAPRRAVLCCTALCLP
jgi:hypothetical protein